MPHVKSLTPLRATAAALVIAASGPAHAQLGATVAIAATGTSSSSNTADATAPVLHQAANSAVRWQDSTDANQIRVRQYVSSSDRFTPSVGTAQPCPMSRYCSAPGSIDIGKKRALRCPMRLASTRRA